MDVFESILLDRGYERFERVDGTVYLPKTIYGPSGESLEMSFVTKFEGGSVRLDVIDETVSYHGECLNRMSHRLGSGMAVFESLLDLYAVYSYESHGLNGETAVPVSKEIRGIVLDWMCIRGDAWDSSTGRHDGGDRKGSGTMPEDRPRGLV